MCFEVLFMGQIQELVEEISVDEEVVLWGERSK